MAVYLEAEGRDEDESIVRYGVEVPKLKGTTGDSVVTSSKTMRINQSLLDEGEDFVTRRQLMPWRWSRASKHQGTRANIEQRTLERQLRRECWRHSAVARREVTPIDQITWRIA